MSVAEDTKKMNILHLPQVLLDLPHQLTTAIDDMTDPEKRIALQLIENYLKNERRGRYRRYQFIKTTVTCDRKSKSGVIKNLSPGGAFLVASTLYPPGTEIALSFPILNFEFPVKLKAEVIWISPKGMGLKFKTSHQLDHRLAAQKLADALDSIPLES